MIKLNNINKKIIKYKILKKNKKFRFKEFVIYAILIKNY